MSRSIFVFGSNLAGKHGGGSAAHAHDEHGAEWGAGVGLTGNSYAIPTLSTNLERLPLNIISEYVDAFIAFAFHRPDWKFNVVAIGCGIAGFTPEDIAPMFADAPDNCSLPPEFIKVLEEKHE
jgi:hypothetical protein